MMIDAADRLTDLKVPPANRLEPLQGNLIGKWSIRVNDQYRIIFVPNDGGSDYYEVELVDYH